LECGDLSPLLSAAATRKVKNKFSEAMPFRCAASLWLTEEIRLTIHSRWPSNRRSKTC